MSNIVITEHDYTTAGNPQYTNFGVVVPGFVAKTYAEFKTAAEAAGLSLDEAGIIEFNNTTDFESIVGFCEKNYAGKTDAVLPTVTAVFGTDAEPEYCTADYTEYDTKLIKAHGSKGLRDGYPYGFDVYDKTTKPKDFALGTLKAVARVEYFEDETDSTINYFKYLGEGNEEDVVENLAPRGHSGDIYTVYVIFKKFPNVKTAASYEASCKYYNSNENGYNLPVLILIGDEGKNSEEISDKCKSYGNQFAYELLNLGYPVLYKILNKIDYVNNKWKEGEVEDLTSADFWAPLKDRSIYDFRYLISGILENNTEINNRMSELASKLDANSDGRGDVIALLDIDKTKYIHESNPSTQIKAATDIIIAANELSSADKFSAIFAPTVEYVYSSTHYTNKEFSGSFHYLMCAANSAQNNFNEWYANSGYNRGLGKFVVAGTPGVKLGDQAVKLLQPRTVTKGLQKAVNLIIKIRDTYYLWGNRTAHTLDHVGLKASHFLNIRQLCATLNKQIYGTCKRFTFDPNSDVLWINFKNAIRPTLETMKANQGIEDYNFELLPSTQKAELRARVQIIPIEAVEDFYIGIALVDSIGDTTVIVTES